MKLEYYGHSFCRIIADKFKAVIDPFDDIGYPIPTHLDADYIFISHEHHDHNNTLIIRGNPTIVRIPGMHEFAHLKSELIPVFHDDVNGAKRGRNNIITIEADNYKLIHCGDLGHIPDLDIIETIMCPDVLFVPVGEGYTLPVTDVWRLIDRIHPRIVIPIHYHTPVDKYDLSRVEDFLQNYSNVIHHNSNVIEINDELLSIPKIIVLNHAMKV